MTYKTQIGMTTFRLIYGKSCHLLVKLEHNAYWEIKALNLDSKVVVERRRLQLSELEKLRLDAYEKSMLYKERIKR